MSGIGADLRTSLVVLNKIEIEDGELGSEDQRIFTRVLSTLGASILDTSVLSMSIGGMESLEMMTSWLESTKDSILEQYNFVRISVLSDSTRMLMEESEFPSPTKWWYVLCFKSMQLSSRLIIKKANRSKLSTNTVCSLISLCVIFTGASAFSAELSCAISLKSHYYFHQQESPQNK